MQTIQLDSGILFDVYCETGNIKALNNIVIMAIKNNKGGLYTELHHLLFECIYAQDAMSDIHNKLKTYHDDNIGNIGVNDLIFISSTFTLIKHKFNYDITQSALVNESEHITELDTDISASLFGIEALIENIDTKVNRLAKQNIKAA